jgi:uracil-DNA glycosylase
MLSKRKLLLVGQAPNSRRTAKQLVLDPSLVLAGRSGFRLSKLAGVSFETYLRRTERVNLLPYYPGENEKGKCFPIDDASFYARRLRREARGRRILLLGSSVAMAFAVSPKPLLRWRRLWTPSGEALFAVVPHPSGVNRWWNDAKNARRASRFLRKAFA